MMISMYQVFSRTNIRLNLMMLLWAFVSITTMAQDITVSGKVQESNGSVLPGVSVLVKGTTRGTQTDADGNFKIAAPSSATLVFSFVGMTSQEVAINNRTQLSVTLQNDNKQLAEVVVIGYGTQRKKDLTGSIASITTADFNKGNIATPDQLVAGKVAGVQITPNGGAPGAGSTIRIRGGASLNASNDPLIVIDGVPLDNTTINGAANPLSLINPNDIESFNILKDASATAIYGSRASNGVIMITTKKGKKGDVMRVNLSTQASVGLKTGLVDVLSGDDFRALVNQYGTATQKSLLGTANTNWQNEIYRAAVSTDNNLSITGALKNTPYRVSVGYTNQNGILKTSNMVRTSASVGLTPMLLDNHLKIDINVKAASIKNKFANQGAIGAAASFDPTQPVYSGTEAYGGYYEWVNADGKPNTIATRNPLGLLNLTDDRATVNRSIGNAQFDYKFHFLPELHANLNVGYDVSRSDGKKVIPALAASNFSNGGEKTVYTQDRTNKLLDFYLNYVKDLTKDTRLDLMAGYSYQDFMNSTTTITKDEAETKTLNDSPYKTQNTLVSFFGRANLNVQDRYLLTFTLRRDGSSRFAKENRWGTFPSAAFAWKISEMDFLKSSSVISDLKLRVGYGVTGQQDVGQNFAYLARYTPSTATAQQLLGTTYYNTLRAEGYNANIKWEQTITQNVGLDFAFKKARLSGSIDYYMKNTSDLLNVVPVAAGTNLTNEILSNVGSIENKGLELLLNHNTISREDFTLDLGFNATYNENKITKLTSANDPNYKGVLVGGISGGVGNTIQIHSVGYPASSFFVAQQVYDASGKPVEGVYVDKNGDGKITVDDYNHYKSPAPRVFIGFNAQATYKKLSAGFVLRGNFGNYVYNNILSTNGVLQAFQGANNSLGNVVPNVLTTLFATPQYFSDYYMQNGSFLRMDNAFAGYDLGKIFGGKSTARLSATVQNVFVITKYTGLNPEVSGGIDNNIYPIPRTFTLGLNIGF
ncbi:TonB-dependent receptor [Runella sp. SP2]|uniref:SusC/RagA family TonB-linked outer membrane protein n=1 Tax=Runella sp. SP2 TaxID=2268026 RepID=UPI000F084BE9|nr:TonB-dependent receptor [Runella sp. SP2]AYQ31689.1 TonB-dependent receptor [Runella sp. SP2]